MGIVTADFSEFGYRELKKATELLKAYMEGRFKEDNFFNDGLKICFNPHSGYVFLSDTDLKKGLLNSNNEIEEFVTCPNCGHEGFKSEEFKEVEEGLKCPECEEVF